MNSISSKSELTHVLVLAGLFLIGCDSGTDGERAQSAPRADGGAGCWGWCGSSSSSSSSSGGGSGTASTRCPAGETCSNAAPNGLVFYGPPFFFSLFNPLAVKELAAGGTQRVRVDVPTAIDALSTQESILHVEPHPECQDAGANPSSCFITLRGTSAGEARLRVVETGTQLLLDRVLIRTLEATSVRAMPRDMIIDVSGDEPVLLAGGVSALGVVVSRDAGVSLVDEGMDLQFHPQVEFLDGGSWDLRIVRVPTEATALTVTVQAAGASWDTVLAVTSTVDSIEAPPWGSAPAIQVPVGAWLDGCFRAWSGGRRVHSTSWQFAHGDILDGQRYDPWRPLNGDGCIIFFATGAGTTVLRASLGNAFWEGTVEVLP